MVCAWFSTWFRFANMLSPSSFSNRDEPILRSRSRGRPTKRGPRCKSASNSSNRTSSANCQRQRSRSSSSSHKLKHRGPIAVRLTDSSTRAANARPHHGELDFDKISAQLNDMNIKPGKRERNDNKVRSRSNVRGVCRGARHRSASNSVSRSNSALRHRQRSRSISSTRKPKASEHGGVRFVEPLASNEPNPSGSKANTDSTRTITFEKMDICFGNGTAPKSEPAKIADGVSIRAFTSGSSKPPSKKKQRNRSASVKRRSRPVFREVRRRKKRDARAPSRSRSREVPKSLVGSPISKPVSRTTGRTRSRSPADHSAQWLSTVNADGIFNIPVVLNGPRTASGLGIQPSLSFMQSDDTAVMCLHERIRDELLVDSSCDANCLAVVGTQRKGPSRAYCGRHHGPFRFQ